MNVTIHEGKLRLFNILLNEDNNYISTLTGNALGHLSIREYDLESGELLFHSNPMMEAQDPVLLKTPRYDSEIHLINDDVLQVIRHGSRFETGSFLVVDTMSLDGAKLNRTDTVSQMLYLDWMDTNLLSINTFEKDEETGDVYFLDYFKPYNVGPELRTCQLLRYNKTNGRQVVSFGLNNYDNIGAIHIRMIKENNLILSVHKDDSDVDILIVDKYTGQVTRSINYNQEIGPGSDMFWKENQVFVLGSNIVGNRSTIEIYKSQGSEMINIMSFSLDLENYRITGRSIIEIENGDFLIEYQYQEIQSNGFPLGSFSGIMCITPEQLGVTSSNIIASDSEFKVYPNPASDYVFFEWTSDDASVYLYDMLGRQVCKVVSREGLNKLDLNQISRGHYLLQIITEKNNEAIVIQKL